ncbi:hypothetical protein FB451DRAFT_1412084 [Mycena latifolia]|nr:hypothetical protein FB451DRAFT_1412084 [Mycena latifolia]
MSSITLRRCTIERKSGKTMYDGIVDEAKALGDTNLCAHELDATFIRAKPDFSGNIYYENFDGTPFVASFIAEIGSQAQGTWMAAYPKNSPPATIHRRRFEVSSDGSGPPVPHGGAGPATYHEKERGENFDVTECITCGEGEGGSEAVEDIVPNDNSKDNSSSAPRTPRKRITKVDSTEKSSEKSDNLGDVDMDAAAQVIGTKQVLSSDWELTKRHLWPMCLVSYMSTSTRRSGPKSLRPFKGGRGLQPVVTVACAAARATSQLPRDASKSPATEARAPAGGGSARRVPHEKGGVRGEQQ